MEQPNWFVHMDEGWMWRWFITDSRGQPLAVSKATFFHRETPLEAVRLLAGLL